MGVSAMAVRTGIEKAAQDVVEALQAIAKPIKTDEEIKQVATISAESAELGAIIAETIKKVGKDGVVTVEEAQTIGVNSEVVSGLEIEKGYISPYMVTNGERMEAEYNDPAILLTDKKISSIKEILPLLEKLAGTGKKELVIIAEDVDGDALTTFLLNKMRGGFSVLAIKAPGYGDAKKELLQDIAVTIGATVITNELGLTFEQADLSVLGKARKVISTKDSTVIVGGKGKKGDIDARALQLKKQREETTAKYDKEKLDTRIASLSGGVAVIRVGAATETEMKYLKLKIEDAVNATKAAIEEGIVPGGGVALVKAGAVVEKVLAKFTKETEIGYKIVLRALEAPLRQIAINAGKDDGAVIVDKIKHGKGNIGYDAAKDEMVIDMIASGIVDPVKVTRSGIQHAASAAAILLTTEVAIAEEHEEKKPAHPAMPDMGY